MFLIVFVFSFVFVDFFGLFELPTFSLKRKQFGCNYCYCFIARPLRQCVPFEWLEFINEVQLITHERVSLAGIIVETKVCVKIRTERKERRSNDG